MVPERPEHGQVLVPGHQQGGEEGEGRHHLGDNKGNEKNEITHCQMQNGPKTFSAFTWSTPKFKVQAWFYLAKGDKCT